MVSVITTKKQTKKQHAKEHKEIFSSDGYVQYLDCGDGTMGACICLNSSEGRHYQKDR